MILQKELKVTRDTLDVIIKIFEELSLVQTQGGVVSSLPREKGYRVNLETSETYKTYMASEEVEFLLTGPVDKIKEYIIQALE